MSAGAGREWTLRGFTVVAGPRIDPGKPVEVVEKAALEAERERTRVLEKALRAYAKWENFGDVAREALAAVAVEDEPNDERSESHNPSPRPLPQGPDAEKVELRRCPKCKKLTTEITHCFVKGPPLFPQLDDYTMTQPVRGMFIETPEPSAAGTEAAEPPHNPLSFNEVAQRAIDEFDR